MSTEHAIVSAMMGLITVFGLLGAWVAAKGIDRVMKEAEAERR